MSTKINSRAKRATSIVLAVGVLGGMAAIAAPAMADTDGDPIKDHVTPYENAMTDIFVGYNQDPLNIDVCYDDDLEDEWAGIITAGLRDWNEATPYVHFRSLRPIAAGATEPDSCDIRFSGGYDGTSTDGTSTNARAHTTGALNYSVTEINGKDVRTRSWSRQNVQLNDTLPTMTNLNDERVLLANEGTVVHELGHALSLFDTYDTSSIMYYIHQDALRVPQAADIAGIKQIYTHIAAQVPPTAPLENPSSDVILLDPPSSAPDAPIGPAPVELGTLGGYRWLSAGDNAPNDPKGSADAVSAYNDAVTRVTTSKDSVASLDGRILEPGVYESDTIALDGTVTLQGDANSVFILRSASTVKFGSGAEVKLTGGVTSDHVIWIAGTQAEVHSGVVLAGTLIAQDRVRLSRSASVDGHVASLNERVHLRSTVDGLQDSAILAG